MHVLFFVAVVLFASTVWAKQPYGIVLNPNGISLIYPVLDTTDWILTQPEPSRLHTYPDNYRITHWADEYYAQDWARGCGNTAGHKLYAGISGLIVLADNRGPYGNTVVIYDSEAGFALKYSHLNEIYASKGEYVLAGKSIVGRVGNTGNVTGSCSRDPGAHLHLSLFRHVHDPNNRPITITHTSSGTGPTQYAARFGYTPQIRLAKLPNNNTVYAIEGDNRIPVSYTSFISHGWAFDKYQSVFNPLANGNSNDLNRFYETSNFWPWRDGSLLKASNNPTVYQFLDGHKRSLSYDVFMCRGLRFNEVLEINPSERDRYSPIEDHQGGGCAGSVRLILQDFVEYARRLGLSTPDLSSYKANMESNRDWEVRTLRFGNINLQRANPTNNETERYMGFNDPNTGQWSGWHRLF